MRKGHIDRAGHDALTSIDGEQLCLIEDVAIGERPHAGDVIGQGEVYAGRDGNLTQQIEPACSHQAPHIAKAACLQQETLILRRIVRPYGIEGLVLRQENHWVYTDMAIKCIPVSHPANAGSFPFLGAKWVALHA